MEVRWLALGEYWNVVRLLLLARFWIYEGMYLKTRVSVGFVCIVVLL